MGSARRGSNPLAVACYPTVSCCQRERERERERLKTTAADGGKGKGKTKNRKLLEEKGRDNKRRLAREEKQ